jgi:hypothetical protein
VVQSCLKLRQCALIAAHKARGQIPTRQFRSDKATSMPICSKDSNSMLSHK